MGDRINSFFIKFNDKALITVINMVISVFAFCGVTARSCFLGRMQENQGLWELRRGFLYQIYTRKLRIWGCDMADYLKV
ncbi:MAG: hypothetical protein IKW30_02895 [Lachnospiraceae bacterium]|nr:hypothetical protein [Lachnospiraceae bacterium]